MIYLFQHKDKDETSESRKHMIMDMRQEDKRHKSSAQKLKNHDIKQSRKNTYIQKHFLFQIHWRPKDSTNIIKLDLRLNKNFIFWVKFA